MNNLIKQLAQNIKNKIKELNLTKKGNCWICEKEVQNWGVMIPEKIPNGLGLGSNNDKMRVAFFPFCKEHDLNDEKNIKKIKETLEIKSQMLKN